MKSISEKVDQLLVKVGAKVDLTECNYNGYERLKKKLEVLDKFIDVKVGVRTLQSLLINYSDATAVPSNTAPAAEIQEDDLDKAFLKCSSLQDIEN